MLKLFLFSLGLLGFSFMTEAIYSQQNQPNHSDPVRQTVRNIGNNNPIKQPTKMLYPEIVAEVNGEKITRDQLAQESLRNHGEEVLTRILHRALVIAESKRQNINITREDADREIDRLVKVTPPGNLTREQYLEIVLKDNKMTYQDYCDEVIWPRLALQALVVDKIQASPEEIEKMYLSKYGPSVGMQMIACETKEKADEIHAKVVADPDSFGNVARDESIDTITASNKGRMQPVFHYSFPDKEIEDRFFAMKPGDISEVIGPYPPNNYYLIFKCENQYDPTIPENQVDKIKELLKAQVSALKLQTAADELFKKLLAEAKVVNIISDPELRKQYPNVAATVNEQPIWLESVMDMCLKLYAELDLDTMISMKLIEQECKKVQLSITDKDIDTDIWIRAAETSVPLPDGSPNIQEYMKSQLAEYGLNEKVYRTNIVWPKVALQKLSAGLVKITDEDIQKSFEANFGEQVQCLGIVVKNERTAREVWTKARTLPQTENRSAEEVFGDLAAQYSLEPGSKQMRGRIGPICKNGGSPIIEEEAFSLKPGDLSSVVQVDPETFVILYCQEIVPPKEVTLDEVKESIKSDLQRKKEVLAINDYYTEVIKKATIINYLTNQTKTPETRTVPTNVPAANSTMNPNAVPRTNL
ncbi:MAG: peptidylprolyl isomerase [Planctomycetia bacterium]|nr:peptidylprolyl isomerase [Planctomycetia bacterium]